MSITYSNTLNNNIVFWLFICIIHCTRSIVDHFYCILTSTIRPLSWFGNLTLAVFLGMMEKERKEKYRKGKMSKIKISKAINVSDGADVRVG